MDILLGISKDGASFDLAMGGADLASESGIRTAVVLSLFCDARARPEDAIPNGTDDRRGWWGDALLDDNDSIGSRLWLLDRSKEIESVRLDAEAYASEALSWLVDSGVAKSVKVTAKRVRGQVLGIYCVVEMFDGGRFDDVFELPSGGA